MLAAQEWGPKFRSLAPTYKPGMVEHAYNSTTESGVQDTYMQILRLCWSAGVTKSMSSRSSERPCLKTKRMEKWLRRTTNANFWAPHPPELVRGSNNTQNVKQWLIKLTVNEITKLEFQCIFSWDSCTQPYCTDFYAESLGFVSYKWTPCKVLWVWGGQVGCSPSLTTLSINWVFLFLRLIFILVGGEWEQPAQQNSSQGPQIQAFYGGLGAKVMAEWSQDYWWKC